MALCQDLGIQTSMALCWGHVPDLTGTVFVVVPGNEPSHPAPSMVEITKPLCWVFWPILTGTKQRFGIGIIVGDACPTVRWGHTQLFKFGMNERAFHSRTIVAMQYERMVATLFAQRSEEHTSELQSRGHLVCRHLLEKKKPTRR